MRRPDGIVEDSCSSESDDSDDSTSDSGSSEGGKLVKAWTLPSASDLSGFRPSRILVFLIAESVVYAALSLLAALRWPELRATLGERCPSDPPLLRAAVISWFGAFSGLVVLGLLWHLQKGFADRAPLMEDVELCIVIWCFEFVLSAGVFTTQFAAECQRESAALFQLNTAVWAAYAVVASSFLFVYTRAIEKRMDFIHKTLGDSSCSRGLRTVRFVTIWFGICDCAAQLWYRLTVSTMEEFDLPVSSRTALSVLAAALVCAGLSTWVLAAVIASSFAKPLSTTVTFSTPQTGIYTMAEAAWARRILRRVCFSMVLPLILSGVIVISRAAMVLLLWRSANLLCLPMILFRLCLMLVESMCWLPMLGLCQEQRPQLPTTRHALLCTVDQCQDTYTTTWTAKVRDLARRSISVHALISFHAELGSAAVMPDYDPWRSTTNDVVRQAIIPLSRSKCGRGGVAYSCMCSSGDSVQFAECMVTHTWSSLFVDLVAAVVADALASAEYMVISEGLAGGHHEKLRRKLDARGALHRTYWICAFCVNQHSSICGSFAPEPQTCTRAHAKWDFGRRDTVTNEIFALCDCSEPKFFNDTPNECELNKFDHMMALLNAEVPGFRHLVVVDREFEVFSRVWCVAELVEAHFSKIQQSVQLCCCDGLRDDAEDLELYISLAMLTVARAEASRPEDKHAILARIPCIREFDVQLQAVIFGEHGLLNRCFVGFGVVEAAANTARRLQALERRGNSGSSLG